jgi:hypothetical protein
MSWKILFYEIIPEMTNFLDIIHRLSLIKETHTRRFGDWSLSPSSGKKRTPTLLGTIDRTSPYLPDDDGDRLVSETSRVFYQG